MDRTQLIAFLDYMIGDRILGGCSGEEVGTPHSPELRTFITARLGDQTPFFAHHLLPFRGLSFRAENQTVAAKALAALLREVADAIDPAPEDAP